MSNSNLYTQTSGSTEVVKTMLPTPHPAQLAVTPVIGAGKLFNNDLDTVFVAASEVGDAKTSLTSSPSAVSKTLTFDAPHDTCSEAWLHNMRVGISHSEMVAECLPLFSDIQSSITLSHRETLVNWMVLVSADSKQLSCKRETLALAVHLVDRMLGVKPFALSKLQLLGAASYFIAAKWHEEAYVEASELSVLACGGVYSVEEILTMEQVVLRSLHYKLQTVTAPEVGYLLLYLTEWWPTSQKDVERRKAKRVLEYLLDATLYDATFVGVRPTLIAAAALYLTRRVIGVPPHKAWVSFIGKRC